MEVFPGAHVLLQYVTHVLLTPVGLGKVLALRDGLQVGVWEACFVGMALLSALRRSALGSSGFDFGLHCATWLETRIRAGERGGEVAKA